MGVLGDFTKGFIIYTVALWVLAIVVFLAQGGIAFAMLLLIVLMIPLSVLAREYYKNRKKERT
jgi:membrane protein implicated in regulation of membrane protease activity